MLYRLKILIWCLIYPLLSLSCCAPNYSNSDSSSVELASPIQSPIVPTPSESPMKAILSFDRTEYFNDEIVKYELELINTSQRDLMFDGRLTDFFHLHFHTISLSGKEVPDPSIRGTPVLAEKKDFVTLHPGFFYGKTDTFDLTYIQDEGIYAFYVIVYTGGGSSISTRSKTDTYNDLYIAEFSSNAVRIHVKLRNK